MKPNWQLRYVHPDGKLTPEGLTLLQTLADDLERVVARLDAIAAVAAPSGGATVDTEARAAVAAIIAGAT